MSENLGIHLRITPIIQQKLDDINENHKSIAGDDTLTQSHSIRWAISRFHKYLINPDPKKLTVVEILLDPDSDPETIIEAINFILKETEKDLNIKTSGTV